MSLLCRKNTDCTFGKLGEKNMVTITNPIKVLIRFYDKFAWLCSNIGKRYAESQHGCPQHLLLTSPINASNCDNTYYTTLMQLVGLWAPKCSGLVVNTSHATPHSSTTRKISLYNQTDLSLNNIRKLVDKHSGSYKNHHYGGHKLRKIWND